MWMIVGFFILVHYTKVLSSYSYMSIEIGFSQKFLKRFFSCAVYVLSVQSIYIYLCDLLFYSKL